jgi:formate hydrogenlyase subunit 3/multisubunit Na+/H+ antiporter MnhD subunit
MVNLFFVLVAVSVIAIFFLNVRFKGIVTIAAVALAGILSGYVAIKSLAGNTYEALLMGPSMFGNIQLRVDALSAWFILVINFTMLTGVVYGFNYMKHYAERKNAITLHSISYILVHISLIGICVVQNSFMFLLLWEVLAISVFVLVIFDNSSPSTIKAGINYLIQSHVSIVFLMIAFLYYALKTNSYSFDSIAAFSSGNPGIIGTMMFFLFFIGFALKAGFIPFHTWLPYAHPAAPSHVSGIMSGVVIKIGIFGILRILLLINPDYSIAGYFMLIISVITGLYGVMLAIVQHDLKRLLAYHSIENIGIIGIGIGVGCLGLDSHNEWMAILGFSGALLHTLNHSLFKSLLFYSAGNVLQAVHTLNIEKLGGLIKKMPKTAILFLIAAVAICGLPPLNGFISEFVIYSGLYNWLYSAGVLSQVTIIFALTGLVLIGGLAILCFTKAFSIVFLGTPRHIKTESVRETGVMGLIPMYFTAALMIAIGLFPTFFMNVLRQPVDLFTSGRSYNPGLIRVGAVDSLQVISRMFVVFLLLILVVFSIRKLVTRKNSNPIGQTWGCGYYPSASGIQYTANSFVRTYAKLAKPALDIEKKEAEISEIFPESKHYATHPFDKIERVFIDKPLKLLDRIMNSFLFLHNGHLQRYILYGIIFIAAVIGLPLIIEKLTMILHFFNSL